MAPADIVVSVVYCAPGIEDVTSLALAAGSCVADAIAVSGVVARHPELAARLDVGIWGRAVAPDTALADGDRVELYRPLTIDPKEARRKRAEVRRRRHGT
jgi:uncharacterized protein